MRVLILIALLASGIGSGESVLGQIPQIKLARPGVLPEALDLHGSVVIGNRLYNIGGKTAGAWSGRVWSVQIGADSTLSSWREETALPELRTHIGHLVQTANNRIYVLGGLSPVASALMDNRIRGGKDVLWSEIQPDGTLAPWRRGAPFAGTPTISGASCCDGRRLYMTGGRSDLVTDQVLMSELQPDGAPGPWRLLSRLPRPLQHHGTDAMNGRVYVWGGTSGQGRDINLSVYSAPINWDGTLGEWREDSQMPVGLIRSGFLAFNDYLVCVGGLKLHEESTNDIWFAHVDEGKVQPWKMIGTDLESRMFHAVAVDKGRGAAFISGGRIGITGPSSLARDVITAVQGFQLPDPAYRLNLFADPPDDAGASHPLKLLKLDKAEEESRRTGRPILALFFSPQVPACRRLYDAIAENADAAHLDSRFILAAVDVNGDDGASAYRHGVFRVPSLLILDGDKPGRKLLGVEKWAPVKTWLEETQPSE